MGKEVKGFLKISNEEKEVLLEILGFEIKDDKFLYSKKTGAPHICPYTNEKVSYANATFVPGSLIVINGDPISLSTYLSVEELK